MMWRAAADLVVVLHLLFVAFVAAGGLLVLRWPHLWRWHVPAVTWGVVVELVGWPCPLTPLELWLRARAGQAGYSGGFLEHYLFAALYPEGLTRSHQIALGLAVAAVNALIYWRVWRRHRVGGRQTRR